MEGLVQGLGVALFHELPSTSLLLLCIGLDLFEIRGLVRALNSGGLQFDGLDFTLFAVIALELSIDISYISQFLSLRRVLASRIDNFNLSG